MIKKIVYVTLTALFAFYTVSALTAPKPAMADTENSGYGRFFEREGREYERGEYERGEYERGERREYERRGEENEAVPPVTNATYKEECGACHFPYQPGLLPLKSWQRILGKLDDHFGDDASLDRETLDRIKAYVFANSAEKARSEISSKILRYERGRVPARISETRYFRKEHRKIRPSVLKRKSIGSFANCIACHRSAERGVYEEDFIKIPRR